VPLSMCGWKSSADDVLQRHGTSSQTEPASTPEIIKNQPSSGGSLREVSMYVGTDAGSVATSVDASPSDASPPAAISWVDVAVVPRPCTARDVRGAGVPRMTHRKGHQYRRQRVPTPTRFWPDRELTRVPLSRALSRHRPSLSGRHLGGTPLIAHQ
jgi:hypothetical protein